jgi:hypothetical protein
VRATDALRRENKFVGRIPWGYVTEGPKYDRRLAATDLGREVTCGRQLTSGKQ